MDIIETWNGIAPDFQVQADDLSKPTATFFIKAVIKMLDLLDIQIESLIKWKPSITSENTEAFVDFLPLSNLTEALNFILLEMDPDSKTLTMADFLEPTKATVEYVFRVIINLLLFINDRREVVAEKVKDVEERSQDFMLVMQKIDQAKIQIDKDGLEIINIEKQGPQKESEISSLKSHVTETDKTVNELKMQYDNIIQEKEEIASDLQKEVSLNTSLMEELKSLTSLIITEEDHENIMSCEASAVQREKDIENEFNELKDSIFKKDADIKTFENNMDVMAEMKRNADNLVEIHKKAREQPDMHINLKKMKNEINALQENDALLDKMIYKAQEEYNQHLDQSNRLETQLDKEKGEHFRKEEETKEHAKTCELKIKYMNLREKELQSKIDEHEKDYESINALYTNTIPTAYNILIDEYVKRIEKTVNEMFEKTKIPANQEDEETNQ